jgi:ABC-type multidrug transport system fused ATPase/permease subunit
VKSNVYSRIGCHRNQQNISFLQVLKCSKITINTGEVMELISNDTQRLVTMADRSLPYMFRKCVNVVVYISWLLLLLGWKIIPGLLVIGFLSLFRILFTNVDVRLRRNASHVAEKRLGYLREVLTTINFVKLNCLEHIYNNKMKHTRW